MIHHITLGYDNELWCEQCHKVVFDPAGDNDLTPEKLMTEAENHRIINGGLPDETDIS